MVINTIKEKEFGEDIFDTTYLLRVENGHIYLFVNIKKKADIEIEYRLYDKNKLIQKSDFTKNKKIRMKIPKFGNLRARITLKEVNTTNEYVIVTPYVIYNAETAITYVNPNTVTFIPGTKMISELIKKENQKKVDLFNTIEKINAILAFEYSFLQYFESKGISNVSLYSDEDDAVLAKLLWMNISSQKKDGIKHLLAITPFVHTLTIPRKISMIFRKTSTEGLVNEEDTIIICKTKRDLKEIGILRKKTGANVLHIIDLINEILKYNYIIKPHEKIQLNNNIKVVTCTLPNLYKVLEKSVYEQEILDDKILLKDVRKNEYSTSTLIPQSLKRFDESLEYNKEVIGNYFFTNDKGAKDYKSHYLNVVNGYRVTINQPKKYKNTIYILGNSVTFGIGTDDSNTIASILQEKFNSVNNNYCVLNCASYVEDNYQLDLLNRLKFKTGDIVISLLHADKIENENYIYHNLQQYFEKPHDMGEVFIDPKHINKIGNEKIADVLFDILNEETK